MHKPGAENLVEIGEYPCRDTWIATPQSLQIFARDTDQSGILVAMTIPARPARSPRAFVRRSRKLLHEFEARETGNDAASSILAEPEQHGVVEQLQKTASEAATPLQLWERALEHPVALFVLPLFALVNAGIAIEPTALPALRGRGSCSTT